MPASEFQKNVAAKLGVFIDPRSFNVAAAQLSDYLAAALDPEASSEPATEKQIAYAATLGVDVASETKRVASARIQEKHDERNRSLIQSMSLAPGVEVLWKETGRLMVISSIAENGRLWFKGGNGMGAFPHQVELPMAQQGAPIDAKASARPRRD